MTLATAKVSIREALSSPGVFIQNMNIWENNVFKMVVDNAGPTNEIKVYGNIQGEKVFHLIGSIIGASTKSFDVEQYDNLKLDCTTYDCPINYLVVTGSAFSVSNLSVGGSSVTSTSNGLKKGLDVNVISDINVASVAIEELNYIDEASSSVFYFGYAPIGSLPSASVWKIERMTIVGTSIKKEYAAGLSTYSQIWDNRASLSYS